MTGYQEISLRGLHFTTSSRKTGLNANGLYAKLENTNRAIMVTDLEIDGVEHKSFYADCLVSGTSYVLAGAEHTVTVTESDGVTVALKGDE